MFAEHPLAEPRIQRYKDYARQRQMTLGDLLLAAPGEIAATDVRTLGLSVDVSDEAAVRGSLPQSPDCVHDPPALGHANQMKQVHVTVAEARHAGDLPAQV